MDTEFAPVSVIIPCYQCQGTIQRALESLAAQIVKPSEVIIIDDASDDCNRKHLVEVVERFQLFKKWIHIEHLVCRQGPSGARNRGWDRANFKYVAFLDADDAWHPQKIKIQYDWMVANPDAAMTGHQSLYVKKAVSHSLPCKNLRALKVEPFRQMLANYFHTRTVMLRRNVPFRFDTDKRYSEDYLLWLEIIFSGLHAFYLDVPLAYTFKPQFGAGGLSADLWKMEKGELDSYFKLYRKGRISCFLFECLATLSLTKHIRRMLVTKMNTFHLE